MKLEATIAKCMNQFPTLYPNRTYVLNHLFCIANNGFEWQGGQLIDTQPTDVQGERIEDIMDKAERDFHQTGGMPAEKLKSAIRHRKSEILNQFYQAQDLPLRAFYPVSEKSIIVNVPPDVQPDWKSGVIEACNLLLNGHSQPNALIAVVVLKRLGILQEEEE